MPRTLTQKTQQREITEILFTFKLFLRKLSLIDVDSLIELEQKNKIYVEKNFSLTPEVYQYLQNIEEKRIKPLVFLKQLKNTLNTDVLAWVE